jgi:hypothetical protein
MKASFIADRPSLVRAMSEGFRPVFRFFYGHHARVTEGVDDAVFSQWADAPFEVDGIEYATAEHWMMAGKARLFGDDETLTQILAAASPAEAKALGRIVRGFDENVWRAKRVEIVTEGNVHKFGCDAARKAYLLATGNEVLVEAAPRDVIWGIGLGKENPAARDPARWRGQNLLGFALMGARHALQQK